MEKISDIVSIGHLSDILGTWDFNPDLELLYQKYFKDGYCSFLIAVIKNPGNYHVIIAQIQPEDEEEYQHYSLSVFDRDKIISGADLESIENFDNRSCVDVEGILDVMEDYGVLHEAYNSIIIDCMGDLIIRIEL